MCFYPVCIILRPAAALSAAAWAHSGPGSDSSCLASAAGPADSTAGRGSGASAEAEFINNPRPPLWGGGAFLTEDATPPSLVSVRCAPPVPLRGPPKGGSEGGKGGALWIWVALLGLTSARSKSPDAAEANLLRLGRRATVRTRPQQGRWRQDWPRARSDPTCRLLLEFPPTQFVHRSLFPSRFFYFLFLGH